MQTEQEFNEMTNKELHEEGILRVRGLYRCHVCGRLCNYIEICSEGHFCSRKCMNQFYDDYSKNLKEQAEAEENELNEKRKEWEELYDAMAEKGLFEEIDMPAEVPQAIKQAIGKVYSTGWDSCYNFYTQVN